MTSFLSPAWSVNPAALARVMALHELLKDGEHFTANTMATRLEVSSKTIHRDIELMRAVFGAKIIWEMSTHTYYYEEPCEVLPFVRLTPSEAFGLFMSASAVRSSQGGAMSSAVDCALRKIRTIIGSVVSWLKDDTLEEVASALPNGVADGEDNEFLWLEALAEAIFKRTELRFYYQKPGAEVVEIRTVHPLHLVNADQSWMLVVHDVDRNDYRHYMAMRVRFVRPTGRTFEPPAGFKPATYFNGSLARFAGTGNYEVRLRFTPTAKFYACERRWHHSQREVQTLADGSLEVTLQLNNLIDIERRVLQAGVDVEVLAPAELRASIHAKICILAERYKPVMVA